MYLGRTMLRGRGRRRRKRRRGGYLGKGVACSVARREEVASLKRRRRGERERERERGRGGGELVCLPCRVRVIWSLVSAARKVTHTHIHTYTFYNITHRASVHTSCRL